ncbi:MAG TPA: zinc-ribbon domain containing protein [Candidatus Limnocylindrales bacterium]
MYTDKILVCADCGQQFVFTASEQDFYGQRGFSEPKRCSSCRAARKASRPEGGMSHGGGYGSSSYDRGPRQMFSATCSRCGKETEVPFRPTNGKPVYCSDCFRMVRGS